MTTPATREELESVVSQLGTRERFLLLVDVMLLIENKFAGKEVKEPVPQETIDVYKKYLELTNRSHLARTETVRFTADYVPDSE